MDTRDKMSFAELVWQLAGSEFHNKVSMGDELVNFIMNFDRGRK